MRYFHPPHFRKSCAPVHLFSLIIIAMSRDSKIILTTMTMVYRDDGSFLVEERKKNDWPGINFPGGHVEDDESIVDSAKREIKEETGLNIYDLEEVGTFEWNIPSEHVRHLCVLYRTNHFDGELISSKEGSVFWIKKEDLPHYKLSTDFDKVLDKASLGLPF